MSDNTNIQLWLKIRKMNNVERASPAYCIASYTKLTDQVVAVGSDAETGMICKFSKVMGEDTTQEEAFNSVKQLVMKAVDGARCSIICYGSTGSGKTHTLSGAEWKKNGIIQQSISCARLMAIKKGLTNFKASCFMVQIYKSYIVDLLRGADDPILALQLEQLNGSASIRNVRHHEPERFLEAGGDKRLIAILNAGLDNRLMRDTVANQASSRSHLLFAVTFTHTRKDRSTVEGKIMFVDLAGSERLAMLGYTLYLYEEAIFINESLSVLGRIIWRLSRGDQPEKINYNGNILTSLLRDTLGGKAFTTMLVCIGPSIMDIEATRDTFRFAQSTGKIKARQDYIKASQAAPLGSRATGIVTKHKMMAQNNPDDSITGSVSVPDLSVLSHLRVEELPNLKPDKVYVGIESHSFGMSMNDGRKKCTHELALEEHKLPKEIRSIDAFFRRDERYFHSIVFHGDTKVEIRLSNHVRDSDSFRNDIMNPSHKSREEKFIVPKG